MRIQIKDGTRSINLRIPTCLIFSVPIAKICGFTIRKHTSDAPVSITPEAIVLLFAELRRIKKRYKKWDLVEIESFSGEVVKIVL